MLTPLLDGDVLDAAASEALVETLVGAGVHGLFLLGTTGEGPGLSRRLRAEFVRRICAVVRGRVPVLVAVSDTSMTDTVELARVAGESGASAVVVSPPYYFRISQGELLTYLRRLVPELGLPVYLYNIPSLTKTAFDPETVRAASEISGVWGLKDSSGDMGYFAQVLRAMADRPDFAVLCGPEELLLESMRLGGHGGIAGGTNLAPGLYLELYRAASAGDWARGDELQRTVMAISRGVYGAVGGESGYLRGMKCAASILGRCRNVMAPPHEGCGAEEAAKVRAGLVGAGILG